MRRIWTRPNGTWTANIVCKHRGQVRDALCKLLNTYRQTCKYSQVILGIQIIWHMTVEVTSAYDVYTKRVYDWLR
jgi:hypothetical protein